jgi:hypothetical protein
LPDRKFLVPSSVWAIRVVQSWTMSCGVCDMVQSWTGCVHIGNVRKFWQAWWDGEEGPRLFALISPVR